MKWQGFLDDEFRRDLIELARDGLTADGFYKAERAHADEMDPSPPNSKLG